MFGGPDNEERGYKKHTQRGKEKEREKGSKEQKSPATTTVWITRKGREAVDGVVEEEKEEEVVVFASTHPHLGWRRVVLCSGNAIVWEPVVISAEDSYYNIYYTYYVIRSFFFFYHTLFAFVDVFGTIDSFVAGRTRASVRTVDRACVAYSVGVTRIRRARVVQMAQQTCEEHE